MRWSAEAYKDRHCHIESGKNMKNYIRTLHSPVLTAVCPLMEDVCLTAVCPPMSINIYTYTACLYRFAVRTSFTSDVKGSGALMRCFIYEIIKESGDRRWSAPILPYI